MTRRRPGEGRSASQLERILLLVPFCIANPDVTVTQLSQRFGATREEILADLDLLFMCGLPEYSPADLIEVFVDQDRVSIRMADYFGRPLRITAEEAIPLYVKAKALLDMSRGGGLDEFAPLESALEKLAAVLEPSDSVSDLSSRVTFHLERGAAKWIPIIRSAIDNRIAVDCEYWTYARDTISSRIVEPHLLFSSIGNWYFTGYCRLAADRRIFRLDRIKEMSLTSETFEPPVDPPVIPPVMVYVPQSDDIVVTLKVSARTAVWFQELLTLDSVVNKRDGSVVIKFRTTSFEWLEKLLLRFGTEVEVVGPAELHQRVSEAARSALALYETAKN